MRLAAIDVGTNTTRLLIAETVGAGYRKLDRRLTFTRLGEGVDVSKRLAPSAIKRTLTAIAEFCSVCGEFGVERLTVAGTSALRDSTNAREFLDAAGKLAGAPAIVLSGEEEARLSFLGATTDLEASRCLICDIGGGSTELVAGTPPVEISGRISLDIGAVRLTERYCPSDPPATEEILSMEAAIDDLLEVGRRAVGDCSGALFVGLGGTVTTLAAMAQGLERYSAELVHGSPVSRAALNSPYKNLAGMTVAERSRIPLLPEGRADVIVAGAAILSRILARWSFDRVVASEKDILDGLVLEMIGRGDETAFLGGAG